MKRTGLRLLAVFTVALAPLSTVVMTGCSGSANVNDVTTVAIVNGEPVSVAEFRLIATEFRAEVFAYFSHKYSAIGDSAFWFRKYGNESPAVMLRKRALDKTIEVKAEQVLIKNAGAVKDLSFQSALKEMAAENVRRSNVLKNDGIIYGPRQYELATFYWDRHENGMIALKKAFAKGLAIKDSDVQNYYKWKQREGTAKRQFGFTRIRYIGFEFITDAQRADALRKADSVLSALSNGTSFEAMAALYNDKGRQLEIVYDSMYYEYQQRTDEGPPLNDWAAKAMVGEKSSVIQGTSGFYIGKCLEQRFGLPFTYNECKEDMRDELEELRFKQFTSTSVGKATVKVFTKKVNRADIFR